MEHWLDDLAKTLAGGMSRRQALRRLGGGLAGAVLGTMLPGQASAQACREVGQQCRSNAECCSKVCNQGTCALPGDKDCRQVGKNCRSNAECCSKLCTNGRCEECPAGAKICEGQCAPCPPLDPVLDQCKVLACSRNALGVPICVKQNKTNGVGCNDGNPCTVNDTCQDGTCRPGAPKNCDDGNPCTVDTCNPTDGACVHSPVPCPTGQTCINGACESSVCPADCSSNPCGVAPLATCGESPTGISCVCAQTATGTCACFQPICFGPACSAAGPPCPAGFACVASCCGTPTCAPLCQTVLPGATSTSSQISVPSSGWKRSAGP